MSDLERVAEALAISLGYRGLDAIGNDPPEFSRNEAIKCARAAVQALMEPSENVRAAGAEQLPDYDPGTEDARACFRAMLTAILNEDGEKK